MTILHDVDLDTCFCKKCGAAFEDIEAGRCCTDAPNVVGVSHLIALRRFGAILWSRKFNPYGGY